MDLSRLQQICWCDRLRAEGATEPVKCPPCLARENADLKAELTRLLADQETLRSAIGNKSALIKARNGLRDVIVTLRGGHSARADDADHALAALDIAIASVGMTTTTPLTKPAADQETLKAQRDEAIFHLNRNAATAVVACETLKAELNAKWVTANEFARVAASDAKREFADALKQRLVGPWRENVLAIGPELAGAAFEQCANQLEAEIDALRIEGESK